MTRPLFRDLMAAHSPQNPLVVPGATHAFMAQLIEDAGFESAYISGAGTAATIHGLPDVGLVTMTELLSTVRHISEAVSLSLFADADQGFGNAVNVMRTVREYEAAGVDAIQIEDQQFPKKCGHMDGKSIIELDEMIGKIEAACAARKSKRTMIVARTDARATAGLDETVRRGHAFFEAGAELIFPEAMRTREEFAEVAERLSGIPLVANMTEWGKSPMLSAAELGAMGYTVVIFPSAPMRIAQGAMAAFLRELYESGTQRDAIDRMLPRADLYRLVGLDAVNEWESKYVHGLPTGTTEQ